MSEQHTPDERFVAERLTAAANTRSPLTTPDDILRRGRRRRLGNRCVRGVALSVLAGVALGATQVGFTRPDRLDSVVTVPAIATTGPVPSGAAGCKLSYGPQRLAERSIAFDGTVRRLYAADDRAVLVDLEVHRWFAGGDGQQQIRGMRFLLPGTTESGPAFGPGTRLLVSGERDGTAADRPVAWGCGFTRYWAGPDAAFWDRAFADRTRPAQDSGPVIVRDDAAVDDARFPFRTAQDWTTYADHVVVATVVAEKPSDAGGTIRLRTLTVRVDEALWSATEPRQPVPSSFEIVNTWGWSGDSRIAIEKRSRLEVGHTYVLPLRFQPAICDKDDGRFPASWGHLAGKAPLPYDEGTIGTGEIAGSYVRAAETQWDEYTRLYDMDSLRVVMNGRSAADLSELLKRTPPGVPGKYSGPTGPVCED